jgi:uncharacterized membrane protein
MKLSDIVVLKFNNKKKDYPSLRLDNPRIIIIFAYVGSTMACFDNNIISALFVASFILQWYSFVKTMNKRFIITNYPPYFYYIYFLPYIFIVCGYINNPEIIYKVTLVGFTYIMLRIFFKINKYYIWIWYCLLLSIYSNYDELVGIEFF